jgi:hypothetical protein
MKKSFFLSASVSLFLSGLSLAQTTGPTPTKPPAEEFLQDGVWTGSLKGGRYMVKAGQIIALSKHEYVTDGVAGFVVTVNSWSLFLERASQRSASPKSRLRGDLRSPASTRSRDASSSGRDHKRGSQAGAAARAA